ncbi:MAG: cupin domain-containing protein [Chloroflexi bacterium]|jgi:quercetin dioxygenase-like cupin family protein|nr:cupin domain-containing protein [Chloroflexota bacterium]
MHRSSIHDVGLLASDETFSLESKTLDAHSSTGIVSSDSDIVLLFIEGDYQVKTGDRVHSVTGSAQAYINAGVSFAIIAGESSASYLLASCPANELKDSIEHDPKVVTGGITILRTDRYDRFPDSGLVRGGMFYLEEGKVATYHSHDAAAEVFVFLKGVCDAKVDGHTERFTAGEVLYVPAEKKHELANVGNDRLEVWLTVTPNVTPSHTFYEEQFDGKWKRTTTRLDGLESRPPSA